KLGTLPISIGVDPAAPLRLDLRAARVRVTNISRTGASAIIAGAIAKADVDAVVIPAIARNLTRIIGEDCGKPETDRACGCPGGSRGELVQVYLDDDDNCRISTAELLASTVIRSLFAPDLKIDGVDALSFGIGVEL